MISDIHARAWLLGRLFGVLTLFLPSLGCDGGLEIGGDDVSVLEAYGRTMGTTYMVKIASPPDQFPEDWKTQIDRELRLVNDQMSTYLTSSELSRFNASESTDWFSVSPETASVVQTAKDIHTASVGAFDVTVGPIVNLWSFGPETRSRSVPNQAEIDRRLRLVDSTAIEVRVDPPAIRKRIPGQYIDLSAIAKGHGVDRVVQLLEGLGCENLFVEIGGDLRVTGRRGSRLWTVGVQKPDGRSLDLILAVPLEDAALATSGDYRNYFQENGQRFSHTIDPRTGTPIQNTLASVSVIAENCMLADAWATAINVLGPDQGMEFAASNDLDVLLIIREEDRFVTQHSGRFSTAIEAMRTAAGSLGN